VSPFLRQARKHGAAGKKTMLQKARDRVQTPPGLARRRRVKAGINTRRASLRWSSA